MSKKLLLGILAGAAAGTVLGILIAPDKGAKTRKKLARTMRSGVRKLKDSLLSLDDEKAGDDEIFDWEYAERPFTEHMKEYPAY